MKNLLLLIIAPFMLISCIKSKEDPKPTICPTAPTHIGKWKQISYVEHRFNDNGEKIKENITEFKEDNEKALSIEFLEPAPENDPNKDVLAKGRYIAKVYDEQNKEVITIDDIYKVLGWYSNHPFPIFEIHNNKESVRCIPDIKQTEKGLILSLTRSFFEGEGSSRIMVESILSFKPNSAP